MANCHQIHDLLYRRAATVELGLRIGDGRKVMNSSRYSQKLMSTGGELRLKIGGVGGRLEALGHASIQEL